MSMVGRRHLSSPFPLVPSNAANPKLRLIRNNTRTKLDSEMPFVLPPHGAAYTDHIIARCRDLITHNIWQGIDDLQLNLWLNNFPNAEQRYFAARVLDILMYRSDPQTKSMLTHLFHRTIPDLARSHNFATDLHSICDRLQSNYDPEVRLVPVMPARQATMASGPLITRLAQKHLNFRKKWIIPHRKIRSTTPFVVFLDDFIGTGNQFSRFLKQERLTHLVTERRCCYVAVAAHSTGIDSLRDEFPDLAVSAVDSLSPQNSLFHHQSLAFPDGTNTIADARAFYRQMLNTFRIRLHYQGGYGGLDLAYAFAHAVPNNCTPLLWWPQNRHWIPLFRR